jgi:hypothetical protein
MKATGSFETLLPIHLTTRRHIRKTVILTLAAVKASGPNVKNCLNLKLQIFISCIFCIICQYFVRSVLRTEVVKFRLRVIEIRGYTPTGSISKGKAIPVTGREGP